MENSVLVPNPKEEAEQFRPSQSPSTATRPAQSRALPLDTLPLMLGNRSAQRVLVPLVIQPKLTIGSPDDEYEKEADTLAEQVMSFREPQAAGVSGSDDDQNSYSKLNRKPIDSRLSRQAMLGRIPIRTLQKTLGNRGLASLLAETSPMPAVSEIRRKRACGLEAEEADQECSECRRDRVALQRSSVSVGARVETPPIVESVLGTPGQPIAQSARKTLEPRFGHDFSEVRVHDDSQAAESASAVTALAYAVGNRIVFGAGQYAPGTNEGNRVLAHELTHSIQQTAGRPNVFRGAGSEETGVNAAAIDFEEKGQVGAEVVSSGPAAEVGVPSDSKGLPLTDASEPHSSVANLPANKIGEDEVGVTEPAGTGKGALGKGVQLRPHLAAPKKGVARELPVEPVPSGVQAAGGTRAGVRTQVFSHIGDRSAIEPLKRRYDRENKPRVRRCINAAPKSRGNVPRSATPAEVCMADEHGKEVPSRRRGTPRTECITSVKSFAEGDN